MKTDFTTLLGDGVMEFDRKPHDDPSYFILILSCILDVNVTVHACCIPKERGREWNDCLMTLHRSVSNTTSLP